MQLRKNGIEKVVLLLAELPVHFICYEEIAFAVGGDGIAIYDPLNTLPIGGEKEIEFSVVCWDVVRVFYQFLEYAGMDLLSGPDIGFTAVYFNEGFFYIGIGVSGRNEQAMSF
jgi:hypothetical protein